MPYQYRSLVRIATLLCVIGVINTQQVNQPELIFSQPEYIVSEDVNNTFSVCFTLVTESDPTVVGADISTADGTAVGEKLLVK